MVKHNNNIRNFTKKRLILYSSLAITILFSFPRVFVLMKMVKAEFNISNMLLDYSLRTVYCFLFALVFFFINIEHPKIKILSVSIDLKILYQRIIVNIVLFVLIDVLLFKFHLLFFQSISYKDAFRFIFNLNLTLEVTFVILISHIYLLLFKNQQIKIDNELLQKAKAEARYEALKNQINPHFLFNSFNTINNLIITAPLKAVDYVNDMSDVFRYILERSKKDRTSLKEELNFLNNFIQLLKGRYGEKLQVTLDVDHRYLSYSLPPMGLQVLFENAVKHNIISSSKILHINVHTGDDCIIISNNIQKKRTPEPSTGIGLSNLNQRCIYLSGRNIEIEQLNNNFTAIIPLIPNENTNY